MRKGKANGIPRAPGLPHALFDVTEATLANGLKVRILPNHAAPIVSLYTFYRVGSRNERPGITGISHLFEHMMFNGSKKFGPTQFDRILEAHGGHSNAYTSTDFTVYYDDFASDALEQVLDLESDRMRALRINPKALASEREVVKEERRLRVDNEIAGLMDEELSTLVWKAHPYRWPIIGWMRDIESIRQEDCEAFFRTYYAPNNAILYLAGDVHPDSALRLVRRYYGDIKRGPEVPEVVDAEPEQRGERRAAISHPAQAPSLTVGYRGPPARDEDTLALDLLQYALAVGDSSRLMRALVYEQQLAVSLSMDWGWRVDPGAIVFSLELAPGQSPEQVEGALYAALQEVVDKGLHDREVQKAKNNLRSHLLRDLATNNRRAHAFGTYELLLGEWRAAQRLADRYAGLTGEQVRAAAEHYLSPSRRSVVTLVPQPT